jgi:hypothetical protein
LLATQRAAAAALPAWPARWAVAPLSLPADVIAAAEPLVRSTPSDTERLEAAREIAEILFGTPTSETTPAADAASDAAASPASSAAAGAADAVSSAARWLSAAAPLLPELSPGLAAAALRFGAECMTQAAARIAAADEEARRESGGEGLGAPPPRV